jgi:transcriptional activator
LAIKGAAAFETWLLSQQRHLAAASEAILHEAALGSMAHGALKEAIGYAVRAAGMSPLDENHQALLIRLYRMACDDDAAAKQFAAFTTTLGAELGVAPGLAVQAAVRETQHVPGEAADGITIEAIVEAGSAAVSAGAVEAGIRSLRTATGLADRAGAVRLRVSARLVLAEALIHALGGLDEAGLATLMKPTRSRWLMTYVTPWHKPGPNSGTWTSSAAAMTGPSTGSPMPKSSQTARHR